MARLRFNNISSRGASNPITFADGVTTTGAWASPPAFPTIASPDYAVVIAEPDTDNEEITYLTAYTAGATTGTFSRGQEGSSGLAHPGTPWIHAPTAMDFPQGGPSLLVASQTLVNPASAVTFSSIPQTAKDLLLVANIKVGSSQDYWKLRFNNDTGFDYSSQWLVGGSAGSYGGGDGLYPFGQSYVPANWTVGLRCVIADYTDAQPHGVMSSAGGGLLAATAMYQMGGVFLASQAVTAVTLVSQGGLFTLGGGSVFNLYGLQ